jgi:hypothetical protein
MADAPACFVCLAPATALCGACLVMKYCSRACQKSHRAAHRLACERGKARLARRLPEAACGAELAAVRCVAASMGVDLEHATTRVVVMTTRSGSVLTVDSPYPPIVGARGAAVVSLGLRARAAGDDVLATSFFILASGSTEWTGNTNADADFNRAVDYIELGGGGTNAGLNLASTSAGCFWASRAAAHGHPEARALIDWAVAEQQRLAAVEIAQRRDGQRARRA